ncbi:hypothetical protein Tco_1458515 [Tanacetum coccineum]
MSADSAVTYTSVHSEARSWSIPSEDPYEEAARQLLEQAPRSPEYVPDPMELEDHVPVYIPEPEHSEDLVPAEDEAPTPLLPSFLYAMSAYSYLPYQPYIIYLYKLSFAHCKQLCFHYRRLPTRLFILIPSHGDSDNYDNESSDDDNDDDDVEKDEEDGEEKEHLALTDPSVVPTDDPVPSRSDCPERKNRNHENQTRGAGARGAVHALREGETDQDPNNIKDEIKA